MKITILALQELFDTGLFVTLDAFTLANKFSARQFGGTPRFEVTVVGVRDSVHSGQGISVPVKPVTTALKADWVVVPALIAGTPEQLAVVLKREDIIDAKAQLQIWHQMGIHIASSCIGAFILADAGLLDNCEATTAWWLAPFFRQCYPKVLLDETRMLVAADRVVTSGALMGHLDLALWLIRKASPELALVVSRYMLADLRASQAHYIIPNHLAQADPLIARFEQWSREHLREGFLLALAAKAIATSPRTLQRRCKAVLGKSPLSYFQDLRIEHAQTLLRSSNLDIDAIAIEVGYIDGATLRNLLYDRLGRGVREIRSDLL